jgi:acetoin utilization deacetylase AcuC-like enzyme
MRWITSKEHNLGQAMRAFYSDHFVLPLPEGHKFPMAKYSRLRERILAEGLIAPGDLHEAPLAALDDLRLVHDSEYVDAVIGGTVPADVQRRIGFPWSPQMVERSRRSVGATIAAAIAALEDGAAANLAGGTHHAFADRGEGFCVFNDVAVAARVLQRDLHARRIAVVDLDVHQGNGTAAIFAGDPSVFTFSMHGDKNFPFRKEASDLDVALADGTGDEEYLALLDRHLREVLNRHQPDFVFYLAGADPFEGDRLGRLKMTIDGLRRRDEIVMEACTRARLPVAISMSGGYAHDIDAIVTIHSNTIRVASRSVIGV